MTAAERLRDRAHSYWADADTLAQMAAEQQPLAGIGCAQWTRIYRHIAGVLREIADEMEKP